MAEDPQNSLCLESNHPVSTDADFYEAPEPGDERMSQRWDHSTFLVHGESKDNAPLQNADRDNRSFFPDRLRRRVPMIEPVQTAIVDSGASWSIAGAAWLRLRTSCKTDTEWIPFISASRRRFRFGDSQLTASLGSVLIHAGIKDKSSQYHVCD